MCVCVCKRIYMVYITFRNKIYTVFRAKANTYTKTFSKNKFTIKETDYKHAFQWLFLCSGIKQMFVTHWLIQTISNMATHVARKKFNYLYPIVIFRLINPKK